jgi:hypothetical protein
MAIVTLDSGQSSVALGGQVVAYVQQMVTQQLPGCPDNMVLSQLGLVLRDFYTKSTGWRDYITGYAVLANEAIVNLNPVDQNRRLQFVLGAFLFPWQGTNEPLPLAPLQKDIFGGSPQDTPYAFYMVKADVLKLYPTPNLYFGNILCVYAVIVPTTTQAILPDIAYTMHLDGLLYGTLARLLVMGKKPWSDRALGMDYERKYRREILIARDFANRGQGPADAWTKFPPFAGRGGSQLLPRATG